MSEKTKGIGLRLPERQYAALQEMAEETDTDPAQLIRHAIEALIKHYKRCGRRLVLPIDFTEVFQLISAMPQAPELSQAAEAPTQPYKAGKKKPA